MSSDSKDGREFCGHGNFHVDMEGLVFDVIFRMRDSYLLRKMCRFEGEYGSKHVPIPMNMYISNIISSNYYVQRTQNTKIDY
jgi:hypothetical protein